MSPSARAHLDKKPTLSKADHKRIEDQLSTCCQPSALSRISKKRWNVSSRFFRAVHAN